MRLLHVVLASALPALACGGGDAGVTDSTANGAPAAAFSMTPEGKAIADVTPLKLAASTVPGPFTYAWDFGDGSTATGVEVTKVFRAPGTFRIALTVSDPKGATSTAARTVDVGRLDGYWADKVDGLGSYGVSFEQQGAALTGEIVTWRRGCVAAAIRGSVAGRTLTYAGEDGCGHVDRFEGTIDDALGSIKGELRFTETDGHTRRYEVDLKRQ